MPTECRIYAAPIAQAVSAWADAETEHLRTVEHVTGIAPEIVAQARVFELIATIYRHAADLAETAGVSGVAADYRSMAERARREAEPGLQIIAHAVERAAMGYPIHIIPTMEAQDATT